jgi:hypothetical protein
MRKSTTFLSLAAAAALVAGVGVAAAPAQAKVTSKVSGSTTITILPEVYTQLGVAGVQFQALSPATSTNPPGTQALRFPVTAPFKPGAVANTGIMTIGASINRIDLSLPVLEYSRTKGSTTGQITFKDDYAAIGADRVTVFDIDNLSVKVTKGKVAKLGATWKRTDRHHITGSLSVVDDAQFVSALNAYIGTTLFTPGMAFGTLDSTVTNTITCTTRKECS